MDQDIFILRFWREKNGPSAWRVSVTDASHQQKVYFASLQDLSDFLRDRLELEAGETNAKQSAKS